MFKYLLTYVPAKVLPGLVNLIGIMLYARIFSQEDYGEFSYILAISALVQGVVFPWIRMSLSRFIHDYQDEEEKRSFLSNIFTLQYLVSFAISLVLLIIYLITGNYYFAVMILIILSSSIVELLFSYLRSEFRVKQFSLFNIAKAILKLVLTASLAYISLYGVMALVLGLFLSNIIIVFLLRSLLPKINIRSVIENKSLLKGLLSYGLPLTFSFLMAIILGTTDRIFIKNFLGAREVAEYSLAYNFSSFITTNLIMIINLAYFPIVMKSYSTDSNYQERLIEFNKLIFLVSTAMLIILINNSYFISSLVFGAQYDTNLMAIILTLISISAFISGIKSYYFDIVFHITKNTKMQLIPIVVGALLNIILNFILIPEYKLMGALYATLISYLLALVLSIVIGQKLLKIPILNKTNIISMVFVLAYTFIFNELSMEEGFLKFIITFGMVITIYSLYIIFFEKDLLIRVTKGKILD